MFAACETRQCENVLIVDDQTLEMTESFIVTLGRTQDLNNTIILDPMDGHMIMMIVRVFVFQYESGASKIKVVYNTSTLYCVIPAISFHCVCKSHSYVYCRGCSGSGRDILPGLRGYGCGI